MKIIASIAASAALLIAASPASASVVRAHTPSGNINCVARGYGGPGWSLTCSADSPGRTMRISTQARPYETRYRPVWGGWRTMRYGWAYDLGPFECASYRQGLQCSIVPRDGGRARGFWISREDAFTF